MELPQVYMNKKKREILLIYIVKCLHLSNGNTTSLHGEKVSANLTDLHSYLLKSQSNVKWYSLLIYLDLSLLQIKSHYFF